MTRGDKVTDLKNLYGVRYREDDQHVWKWLHRPVTVYNTFLLFFYPQIDIDFTLIEKGL